MGISIQEYRSRIGSFLPNSQSLVKNCSYVRYVQKLPCNLWVSLIILSAVVFSHINLCQTKVKVQMVKLSQAQPSCVVNQNSFQQVSCYCEMSNFYARYLYGNKQLNGIKIAHFNKGPGYLGSKKNEIANLISEFHPHVLGISEANFFKTHDPNDVQFTDYTFHTCPTLGNPDLEYSRIIVYTHNSLVCEVRSDLMNNDFSSIWLQLGLPNKKKILVCQVYREWQLLNQNDDSSQSVHAQLQRWVTFLDQWEAAIASGLEVLVLGDMNINHLDWSQPIGTQSSQSVKLRPLVEKLFTKIFPHSVSQCVTVPTRFMQGQTPSGLDHFYTNHPEKLSVVQTQFFGGSDHKMIMATRHSKEIKKKARYIYKRSYKSFCVSYFLCDLSKVSWWPVYQCSDIDSAVEIFTDQFLQVLDLHAPMRTIQTRSNYAPWLSENVKKLMQRRNEAQNKAVLSQSYEDWNMFRKLRNEVTKKLRTDEKKWHQEKLNKFAGSSSEQWHHVMGWLGWKNCGSPSQLFYGGRLINKPIEIANIQNEYFVNKVNLIQQNLPSSSSDPLAILKGLMQYRSSTFHIKAVHPDLIEQVVKGLKNSKSAGLDNIDTQILKLSLPYILPCLTHIVNLSIANSQFPTSWKTAKIIPLYKKDDPLDPKNYRPVAILPVISKVLERVVFLQMSQYLKNNGLLHPNHHGFRASHSTATCLIQMYDKWVEALEEKKFTGVCFLDLSAAFDIVNHPLLLEKLKLYGFDSPSIEWIRSYLFGRHQLVYIEGKMSKLLPVSSGVPQGSILGPLLYIIFTNELPEVLYNHRVNQGVYSMHCDCCGSLCCYADDSTFAVSSSNLDIIENQVSEKYNKIAEFMCSNQLKLNEDKTHLMLVATDRAWRSKLSNDSLILTTENSHIIRTSSSENLLGGIIAQNLKWTEHILLNKKSLIRQLGTRLNALQKICQTADFKTRKMFADGLFMSKLTYLIQVWGGCEDFLVKCLQVVQNKAARLVTNRSIYTPTKVLLKECGWLSVSQLIFFHTVILLFKVRKDQEPRYIFEMAVSNENPRYSARTGQAGKLRVAVNKVPKQSVNFNSFRSRSVKYWNQLPHQLRKMENLSQFRISLKTWVQENVNI